MALADSYARQAASAGATPALSRAAVKSRTGSTALQYQRAQVETASPARLVIMLYEGAIRFCQIALDAMAVEDIPIQHENLLKAQCIVAELLGSLNREKGGEIAENLARLYPLMFEQLVEANLHADPEPIKFVQTMLRDLLPSWVEVERRTSEGTEERKEEEKKRRREEGTQSGRPPTGKDTILNPQSPIVNRQSAIGNPPRLGNLNA